MDACLTHDVPRFIYPLFAIRPEAPKTDKTYQARSCGGVTNPEFWAHLEAGGRGVQSGNDGRVGADVVVEVVQLQVEDSTCHKLPALEVITQLTAMWHGADATIWLSLQLYYSIV